MLSRHAVLVAGLLAAVHAGGAPPASGGEAQSLEAFYPLLTRRPVLEREIELGVRHQKGADGRESAAALTLDWVPLERWQTSLEVPAGFTDSGDRASAGGVGDLVLENKVVIYRVEPGALAAAGLSLTLPTGDHGRGTGGETALEPFLTAGMGSGRLYLVGALGYRWTLDPGRAQDLTAGGAAGWRAHPLVIPLLELTTVTRFRRDENVGRGGPVERPQLYLTPGVTCGCSLAPRSGSGSSCRSPAPGRSITPCSARSTGSSEGPLTRPALRRIVGHPSSATGSRR